MKKVLFPGTFDPPTLGHVNIIERAAMLCDFVYVAIGNNQDKTSTFSLDERIDLLSQILGHIPNIEIISFDGLLVDCAKDYSVTTVIRAIRNGADYEYESIQAGMNAQLGNLETLYMVADEKYRLVSSSRVREIGKFGHRLHAFVPKNIEEFVFRRLFCL